MSAPAKFTIIFLLTISLVAVLSCQQDRPTQPAASGPFVMRQTWPMDSIRMPDSVSWVHKGTSGAFSLTRFPKDSFQIADSFAQSIVSDTLTMSLWTLGLRTTTAATVVQADGGLLVIPGKRDVDSLVVELLLAFDSLRTLDRATYGSSSDPVRSQILSLQKATASLILAGKKSIDSLPSGLDSLAVARQILVHAAKSGSNIASVAKVTGLDTASLDTLAQSLLQSGVLTTSDSATLYPPYPVRVKSALSVSSPVIAGGPVVAVQGAFAWTKGVRISNPRYAVHTTKGPDTSFQFPLKSLPQANDTAWNLAGSFFLQAPPSATPGIDTLVVTISDDSGHVATAWATFQVVAKDTTTPTKPDTTRPSISFVAPAKDLSVANEIQNVDVEVAASDTSGIDSVKINNVKVTAAPYKVSVPLAIGANVIKALAWDKAGNKSDTISVTLTRAKAPGDTVPPKIVRSAPIENDTTVGHLVTTATLSYLVTDDSLASVSLDGKTLTSSSSLYQANVELAVGPNTFVLLALDKHGNPARDTVKITRRSDTTKPVASWQGGSKDTSVWAFVPNLEATWKVTDNALKLVTINGAAANKSGDLYSQTVDLATDATWIRLMALDSSGNTTLDSVKVTRKYDKTPPTAVFQKTKYRLLANAVTTDTLVWTVSDDLKLKSVKINDSSFAVSGGTYTLTVNLAVGTHRYALVATDSAGNQTFDTATVARTALAPTHSAPAGRYIGTVYDTLKSPGADSILYSTDLSTWQQATGPVVVATSKTVYAKALPGEQIIPVSYTVSQVDMVAMGGDGFIGQSFTVFQLSDGSVYGAGSNSHNAFGIGLEGGSTPQKVGAGAKWIIGSRSATGQSLFELKTDNTLYAAGTGGPSLGIGAGAPDNATLTRVRLDSVASVAGGGGQYTYFLKSNGTVWAASGNNPDGFQIPGLSRMASVSAGSMQQAYGVNYNGVGVDSSGNVWAWRYEFVYDFSTEPSTVRDSLAGPTKVATGAKSAILGGGQMIVVNLDGSVLVGGANGKGQLGFGNVVSSWDGVNPNSALTNIVAAAAGSVYSLFLRNDGTLYVAGMIMTSNPPEAGDVYTEPTILATDVTAIWDGVSTFIFKKKDGSLWGAGWNLFGELGLGVSTPVLKPARINF